METISAGNEQNKGPNLKCLLVLLDSALQARCTPSLQRFLDVFIFLAKSHDCNDAETKPLRPVSLDCDT